MFTLFLLYMPAIIAISLKLQVFVQIHNTAVEHIGVATRNIKSCSCNTGTTVFSVVAPVPVFMESAFTDLVINQLKTTRGK